MKVAREKGKGHTRSSLSSPGPSQWPSPPSSHRDKEEVGTQERHESPSRELPPFFHLDAFSLLIRASIFLQLFSILCLFLFPFIALHFFDFSSSDTHAFSLFIRLEILVSPVPFSSWANLLLTFRRVSMSRGGNTRMAAMGGESAHWHLESVKQK